MIYPERIRAWVEREFNPAHVESVFQDLLDVATGNREGNTFERNALAVIFPETTHKTQRGDKRQRATLRGT